MSEPAKVVRFATRLKQLREQAGLSIADLCKASALPRQTIHLLERGEREPGLTTARKLAQALGRSLADFECEGGKRMTALIIEPQLVPLRLDDTGTLRVGGTRVTLDVLLETYEMEGSAEAVAQALDVLDLADVHAVLAWCLRHPQEVAAYRERREREAKDLKRQLEAEGITRTPAQAAELRLQLLARQAQRERDHAASGQ